MLWSTAPGRSPRDRALAGAVLAACGLLAPAASAVEGARSVPAKQAVRMEADGVVVYRILSTPLPAPGQAKDAPGALGGVSLALAPGVDPAPHLARLVAAGARPVSLSLRPEGARIDVVAPAAVAARLLSAARAMFGPVLVAATPASPVPVPLNDDSIWVGQSGDAATRATPVFDHGITGTGEVVSVWDTGMDPDMCYFTLVPGDFTPAQSLVPPDTGVIDLTKKTIAYYVSPGATAYDPAYGHGTGVAGCLTGDSYVTPSTPAAPGHDPNDGMAPNARLVLLDGGDGGFLSGIVGDLTPTFQQAYDAGSRIQNHSWGSPNIPFLSPFAVDIDRFAWRHEDMLFVSAAGNSGAAPGDATIVDPAGTKNLLAVGATTNGRVGATDLTTFTSRGPAFDGRIKPEVMAPGNSQATAAGTGVVGDADCGANTLSGTSFASPTAAGWTALARQYHREGWLPSGSRTPADATSPSAALLRATLVASAVPLEGIDPRAGGAPVTPPPSMDQGFGRPALDLALYFAGDARRTTVLDLRNDRGLRGGEAATLALDVGASGEPLTVAIVWTDPWVPPGTSPALVNDLDLILTAPGGAVYRGNAWAGGVSVPGGAADRLNTVEAVKLPAPTPGTWQVRVEAASALGRPGLAGSERQGFALVATYGGCAAPAPAFGVAPVVTERPAGFDVGWGALAGAVGYVLERADGPPPHAPEDYRLLPPGVVTPVAYLDADVQCGAAYSYRVRAWNGCALGPASPATDVVRTTGSCSLPPEFAGIADARPAGACGQVTLSWPAARSRCPCSSGIVYSVWASPSLPVDTAAAPLVACTLATSATVDVGAGSGLLHFLVRAEDRVPGGTGRCGGVADPNLETRASVPLSPTVRATLVDRFETGSGLWTLQTLAGALAWGMADEPFASSTGRALVGLDLPRDSDSVVELLPDVVPGPGTLVSFFHTWETEGRYDGGVVELSTDGGASWVDAGPRIVQGPYPDWMMAGPGNSHLRPGYTGGVLGPMTETLVWLGDLAGSAVSLRFRMLCDGGGARQRWAIDDFRVIERDCPSIAGALVAAAASNAPVCLGTDVSFDGSATYGGVPPHAFSWDFGDGVSGVPGIGALHRYATPGDYTATLTVTDGAAAVALTTLPVRVVAEAAAPAVGNTLHGVKAGTSVALGWSEPAGGWTGTDVLVAVERDLGDLAPFDSVPWSVPRAWLDLYAAVRAPALKFYRVRLRSECSGTPGPP